LKGFVFDENVPSRLKFQPSQPVMDAESVLGPSASDTALWDFAFQRECVIVTKDADFSDRILASAPPPWVVHLRFGNLRRRDYHALLARVWPRVEALLPAHKLINVFADRIEAVR